MIIPLEAQSLLIVDEMIQKLFHVQKSSFLTARYSGIIMLLSASYHFV